ncbi:hypothetical protein ACFS5L_17925 [Streptomyces phyllanthi]|uniref:hypothetical protein n=1 Tax=Streptomyces phyllanthi TaxID=1803180 RepID=UPI0031EA8260
MERGSVADNRSPGEERTAEDGAFAVPPTRVSPNAHDGEQRPADPESHIIRGED